MEEKEELLSYVKESEDGELSVKTLLIMLLFVFVSLVLFVPKIYLRSEIYYLSREIDNLRIQKESLSAENEELLRKLEDTKFRFLTTEIPLDLE